MPKPMSDTIKQRLMRAAATLGTRDPVPEVGRVIDQAFHLPEGDERYGMNNLTPGAVPFEPSFSEREPNTLRFTLEPLGPDSSPFSRRQEATREMRRLVGSHFGQNALRWFDARSEEWRSMFSFPRLNYGAWFGTSYDRDGLRSSKVYYELNPDQLNVLPPQLLRLMDNACDAMPTLLPIFTQIAAQRDNGSQRVVSLQRGPLRIADLRPLMERMGLAHQLPGVMQILGLVLGGRFDLPDMSLLVGIGSSEDGPELKLYVVLGMIPDLPPSFLSLITLGLAERPRELRSLERWLMAYTPETVGWPGDFTTLSIRVTANSPARVGLYLRPIELELAQMAAARADEQSDSRSVYDMFVT